jgi:lipid II:glycine glycyltransferase (peptidoglycan interpeptide bridge formation enzyme)
MTLRFSATIKPSGELVRTISSLNPGNPFYTSAYLKARASLGEVPCVFALGTDTDAIAGCTGFVRGNYFTRRLEITSLPALAEPDIFWGGLRRFCRDYGVWDLCLETFASAAASIPSLSGELGRRKRYEYVLDLTGETTLSHFRADHRRNIARARKAGLRLRRSAALEACRSHVQVLNASMERRRRRGERVSLVHDTQVVEALLKHEAGEIFQAVQNDVVLSSILVLKSAAGGYSQSTGTLPEGMAIGASPFLIAQVANVLKVEGINMFNLGGAGPENRGLQQFKEGFRPHKIDLEAAAFSMVSPIKSSLRTPAKMIKNILGCLRGNFGQWVSYQGLPDSKEETISLQERVR